MLSILKAAYPNSYKGLTREEANGVAMVWAAQFAAMPSDIVMGAINKLISTHAFPPAISEVKDKIHAMHWEATEELLTNDTLSAAERKQYMRIREATAASSFAGTEPTLKELFTKTQAKRIEERR